MGVRDSLEPVGEYMGCGFPGIQLAGSWGPALLGSSWRVYGGRESWGPAGGYMEGGSLGIQLADIWSLGIQLAGISVNYVCRLYLPFLLVVYVCRCLSFMSVVCICRKEGEGGEEEGRYF